MTHNGWITPFSISFIFALESIYLALMMKELCWSQWLQEEIRG